MDSNGEGLAQVGAEVGPLVDADFLRAVLANEPMCMELHLRADEAQHTMLLCESLAINFLFDLGRTDQGARCSLLRGGLPCAR